MNVVKVKKILYVFVYFVGLFFYFIIFIIWGVFFIIKFIFENIFDNFGVMVIYYVFMSLLWFFYLDWLGKDINKIIKEINDKKM